MLLPAAARYLILLVLAAITVVIALLGLLLLGLSFMQGVALGAATAVLATMFAALTIIPAMIGGSGGFLDGVLREFDRRGGFRFYGTNRRFNIPGKGFRAQREAKRKARAELRKARHDKRHDEAHAKVQELKAKLHPDRKAAAHSA